MRYGYFDDAAREYVIDRMDVPVSMTNYLGTQRMGTVISHNAGGYSWLDSPQHHRITRFRPNGVPMDWPGHYVYLKDEDALKQYQKEHGSSIAVIGRMKGLGECDADELSYCLLDEETRNILQLTVNDFKKTNDMFQDLYGKRVEPRVEFLSKHLEEARID